MLNWAFADPLLFARPIWPWLVLPPTLAIAGLILATVWVGGGIAGVGGGRFGATRAVSTSGRADPEPGGHGGPSRVRPRRHPAPRR